MTSLTAAFIINHCTSSVTSVDPMHEIDSAGGDTNIC